jgi:uncharacterized protein (DUF2141 family)
MAFSSPKHKEPATGNLTVIISGLENTQGEVQVGLYNNAGTFPTPEKEYLQKRERAGNVVKVTFSKIPAGEYAMAIYHDANNDGKCNKNLLGIPTEGYCFSNNFKPSMSVPKFEKCKISVSGETLEMVRMIYM